MPIKSSKNQYFGINAHLNSVLQSNEGNWAGFHNGYIFELTKVLNAQLPPYYEADNERSLQIDKPLVDIDPDEFWAAIVIREMVEGDLHGRSVIRIELLSPINKPLGKDQAVDAHIDLDTNGPLPLQE